MSKKYESTWFGVPIVQISQNLHDYQKIIWEVKPDLIIETGIKFGGSLVFSASMLTLLEAFGEIKNGVVIGVDIRDRHLTLPLGNKITILKGSSIAENIVRHIKRLARRRKRIMIFLDSNHTHDHVLAELRAYSPLVSVGSYIVVNDTGIENFPKDKRWGNRDWHKGNSPMTAVWEFIKQNNKFKIDKKYTGHPDGYLKRIK